MTTGNEPTYVFQIIDVNNGDRCEPFLATMTRLREVLETSLTNPDCPEWFSDSLILPVGRVDGESLEIVQYLLVRISNFLLNEVAK